MQDGATEGKILRLKARIAALEHILEVSKRVFQEQTLRLESALAEAESMRTRYEFLLNSAGEGILGLDMQGNHKFANPAAAKMLGYSVEELLGQHSHATWHRQKADESPDSDHQPFEPEVHDRNRDRLPAG